MSEGNLKPAWKIEPRQDLSAMRDSSLIKKLIAATEVIDKQLPTFSSFIISEEVAIAAPFCMSRDQVAKVKWRHRKFCRDNPGLLYITGDNND